MGDLLAICLLFGGGIVAAVICLIVATLARRSKVAKRILCASAFVALVLQAGCWSVASSIGRATGGGDSEVWISIIGIAAVIAFIWTLLIIGDQPPGKPEK
jgi:hypothetical protein